MSMKQLTKSKSVSMAIERLPEQVDLRPLLDEKTQEIIRRKEQQLSDLAQGEDVAARRIVKLEREIREQVGAKMDALSDMKKAQKALKAKRMEIGRSISVTIEDALAFVPGDDVIAKRQHLTAQRKGGVQ